MRPIHHRTLALVAFLLGSGAAVAATPPTTGLGQSWPNAPDLSASSHFHVYSFTKSNVRYIQVNDLAGNVRGAVAYIDGQLLELPIGVDANRWTIVSGDAAPSSAETVYHDDTVTVRATPQSNGAVLLLAEPCNPLVCSVKVQ